MGSCEFFLASGPNRQYLLLFVLPLIPRCDSLMLVTVGMEEAPLLQKLLRGMIEPIRALHHHPSVFSWSAMSS